VRGVDARVGIFERLVARSFDSGILKGSLT
jgi:hypothetical protein